MSYKIYGRWKAGWALDLHTISSIKNSDGSYTNTRSTIGEALFKLKYRDETHHIDFLVDELVKFLRTRMVLPYIDVIIATPPSVHRNFQPVYEICSKVAYILNIPVDFGFIQKIKDTRQLKEIDDINQRQEMIKGAFSITDINKYRGKKVLIIDDLFRSGTTLNEISDVLYSQANVNNVYVVTLTKTRSKK